MPCYLRMKSAVVMPTHNTLSIWQIKICLLLTSAGFYLYLAQFHYLPGTDAYYYALQTHSLLTSGSLKVPDGGILYYGIALLAASGFSIEMAFIFLLSGIFLIYNLIILKFVRHLNRNLWPVFLIIWACAAPFIVFHIVEFPKLSFGLAMLTFCLYLLLHQPWYRPTTIIVLIFSATTHPMIAVTLLLYTLGMLTSYLLQHRSANYKLPMMTAALGIIGFVLIGFMLNGLWPGIALRLTSLHFGGPGLLSLITSPVLPSDLPVTALVFWLLLAISAWHVTPILNCRSRFLPLLILTIALWPSVDSGLAGTGGRLAAASVFLTLPLIYISLNQWFTSRQTQENLLLPRIKLQLSLLAVIMLSVIPLRLQSYQEMLIAGDYGSYNKVVKDLEPQEIPMLIAHRGLAFYYTYNLQRDAFHFDPEPHWAQDKIWRVTVGVTAEELAYYGPTPCVFGATARKISETDYLLVREDCWQQFRNSVSADDNPDLYLTAWGPAANPSHARPAFLRQKHKNRDATAFPAFADDKISSVRPENIAP